MSDELIRSQLTERRGDYGFDAPYMPVTLGLLGVGFLSLGILALRKIRSWIPGIVLLANGAYFLLSMTGFLYTTRLGKFLVWAEILARLGLRGDEHVLDLGCGRGAVLLMAAALLPHGRAVGVDLWKTSDQSGNAADVTRQNAVLEGVAERVELQTADMRKLPFANNTYDVVLSSLAIHNITEESGRMEVLTEAVRVLKPGGKLIITDFQQTERYAEHLRALGMSDVSNRRLDWRFWYGSPWTMVRLVSARKPA
ncbi:class I SAM-dependent methyltransferase [Ktedonosporobacter rubrisoli]|uniref:Class I SAM-dependent methyltransferase n=1 Tax=Ktedonosporobacter rubrisoli TaxID=2509675 RepID=A0A4P6JWZ5_KTERU|nr:class I SAM-dependent methyltransferase [Ktedonosporobacter rubrisoli]QBD80258.1 class I SAM-dependent methyltransferase [Ktedonosporobacter rubrisoli]